MSLIGNIIELRIEGATQIADMQGRAFVFSRIGKVCDLTSKLIAALKALGNNLPIHVQDLLPQLKIALKEYVEQSQNMKGYYGGIVDLPYKEAKLIRYIDSYADSLEDLIKIDPTIPSFDGLTDALAAERVLVETLKEENKKLYKNIASQEDLIKDYEDKLSRHNREGVIYLANGTNYDEQQRFIKTYCSSRGIPYEYASFGPPKYNQLTDRLEISYRY